ncbi:Gfo/Idh/MocA family protein [Microbacterium sp. A84]|uniref:Gfo/Idh/MocA family protein n=1 Tax=Microbacterium sp. A84 TaxID=3450715 RepID=UPI003F439FE4
MTNNTATEHAPLGVGIIGLGGIGRIHARAIGDLPNLGEVRAVAHARHEALAACGLPTTMRRTVDELLADDSVQIVAICTPSDTHADLALRAIESGKHVVVEKPIALDAASGRALIARADALGRTLVGIAQRRYEPQNIALAELLASGALGRPLLGEVLVPWYRDDAYYRAAPWRSKRDGGGGSLANQGLHNLDLALMLLGPVVEVTGQSATVAHEIDVEDATTATLRFASGAMGILATTTGAHPGHNARLSVITTTGRFELDGDVIREWTFDVTAPMSGGSAPGGGSDPLAIGHAGHLAQWRDVLGAIAAGRAPRATGQDAVHTAEVIAAVYRSAATRMAVQVETVTA